MDVVLTETKATRGPGRPSKASKQAAAQADEVLSADAPAQAPAQAAGQAPARAEKLQHAPPAPHVGPLQAALPLTDPDIEMVDRKGAVKLLGKSVMTMQWLEANAPDFPAAFPRGKNNSYFLANDLRAYVFKKAARANSRKQAKMLGIANKRA